MIKRTTFAIAVLCFGWIAGGAEPATITPLSTRFATASTEEAPDFQKHVVPLLGRLGCNGRACHGSFQGRGGFQLSLFGYDFKADHEALIDPETGRVDLDDVAESLILAKPLDADIHEGGQRFDDGSWQHHVLQRWVQSGAKFEPSSVQKLIRLEVTPSEIQFKSENEQLQLKAIAHWEDGSNEDVTEICRFTSNDDAVAAIEPTGLIKSGVRGDTHVVVSYDNAVVPVPIIHPFSNQVTGTSSPHPIDQLVQQKLDKLGVVPSGLCNDAEFIRRVSFDITGMLPAGEAVREFLADQSPNKRTQLIDKLLESPSYGAWWATRFSDWTGNSEEQLNNVLPVRNAASRLWYEWLRKRLDANLPYDEIIEGIVTAESRETGETYTTFCENMTKACQPGNEELFADRDGLPMFWARQNFQKPEDRAIGFAYTFLGVRIECAQCHKHPFDQWSKQDFEQFSSLFAPIQVRQNSVAPEAKQERDAMMAAITNGKKLNGGDLRKAMYEAASAGTTVPFSELLVNTTNAERAKKQAKANKKAGKNVDAVLPTGRILGGQTIALDKDPREALMEWLRSPENPYFAKAVVNRVWSNYFGIGIVDPTDDMNLANPPSNAALLNYLATELIKHDFDLKWLHRKIANSETYQRSAEKNETNQHDLSNFARHIPRRLPAEVVYDAVVLATGSDSKAQKLRSELDDMAIANGKPRARNQSDFALQVFGQSIRETNCDCDRSDSPSLLQSIYLRNDMEMHRRLTDKDGWVSQACKSLGVEGPKVAASPAQSGAQLRAEAMRKQFVARIKQLQKLPEERQAKTLSRLEQDHGKLSSKMKQFGYSTPALEELRKDPDAWTLDAQPINSAVATATLEQLVEEVYLRALSRFPDQEEVAISVAFINESQSPANGVESLLWALVNTKEFIITH